MPVESYTDSGAGIITMADGDGGNRLNSPLISGIQKALDSHSENPAVRFILLRSKGQFFCLGMDLDAYSEGSSLQESEGTAFQKGVQSYADLLAALHECPKTTAALLEGSVKAGGVGLAAACDVVIASDTVDFELSELYLGLIPANVMPYILSTRMPVKRASYLVQTAAVVKASQALNWGLVDEVYPEEELEKAVRTLGRRLMRISPAATLSQKRFVSDLETLSPEQRGARAVDELMKIASDADVLKAVRAFSSGNLPPWFEKFRPEAPLRGNANRS